MTIGTDFPEEERRSQEELERIKAFRLPSFVPPYPYKRNRFAEKAIAETHRWVEKHSLLVDTYKTLEELQAFYKADFSELAMVAYVDCSEKETAWGAKFFTWLFTLDDHNDASNDDVTNFWSPETSSLYLELNLMLMWSFPDSKQFYKNFVEFLDEVVDVTERNQTLDYLHSKLEEARLKPGTGYDTSSHQVPPLCRAFRDLWAPLCETMPIDFLRRWGLMLQHHLLSTVREIRNRKHKTILSVDDYIAFRRDTVALWICLVIIEFLDKVHLPDEVFDCPEMQRFLLAAIDVLAWHNDLWSFQKEALRGDVHNLVNVLSHEQDCSYAEAGMIVYQMMLEKLEEMEKAFEDLEKVTPTEYQHAISRYSHLARTLLVGSHHWHENCVRYKVFST